MNNQNDRPEENTPDLSPEEQKKIRIRRVVLITSVVLLISVIVIIAITSAANRSKKPPVDEAPGTSAPTAPRSTDERGLPTIPRRNTETPADSETATKPKESTTEVLEKVPVMALPVSGALSVSHDPDVQVFSPTMEDYRVHLGVDINCGENAPVYAAADGKVQKVWEDPMMGYCVALSHDGKAVTFYKNLAKELAEGVKEGSTVRAGQLIGTVGDSAMLECAQDPHLHFEVTVNGIEVDPLEYFSAADLKKLGTDNTYED